MAKDENYQNKHEGYVSTTTLFKKAKEIGYVRAPPVFPNTDQRGAFTDWETVNWQCISYYYTQKKIKCFPKAKLRYSCALTDNLNSGHITWSKFKTKEIGQLAANLLYMI